MERSERFKLFVQELIDVAPAGTYEEARELITTILNGTEDKHSGAEYNPEAWRDDGRMYPPEDDFERKSPFPGVRVFRTRGHYIFIGDNGAIKIASARQPMGSPDAEVVLNKSGKDGRCCP